MLALVASSSAFISTLEMMESPTYKILGTEDRDGDILVGDGFCTLRLDVLLCAGVEDFIFPESADPGGVVGVSLVAVVDVLLGGEDSRDPGGVKLFVDQKILKMIYKAPKKGKKSKR